MTITRNYHGGGTLTRRLCNLPKGGGADDRTKRGSRLPVPGGGLPFQRERDTSVHELARYQLGAGPGAHDTGCQQGLPGGQRGRRGRAHADRGRAAGNQRQYIFGFWYSTPKQRRNRSVPLWRRCIFGKPRTGKGSCEQRQYCVARRKRLRLCQPRIWRWPAPQQSDAIPRGVHLAADCVTPGRGCAV